MPNGDTSSVQDAVNLRAVTGKLKARRDRIAALPVDKQLTVYGVAFDRFIKPYLTKQGVSKDEDLNSAKDQWIVGLIDPSKQGQLPTSFGVDKSPKSYLTEASAELVGIGAGAAGGFKNILDFVSSNLPDLRPPSQKGLSLQDVVLGKKRHPETAPGSQLLGEIESKGYGLAHEVSPSGAEFGAAFGHLVPSILAYEAGAGMVPKAAKGTPLAWRLLSRLGRAAVGGAAGSVPYGIKDTKGLATEAAINTAIDAILGGVGKVGAKGASKIISKVTSSGSAAHVAAANAVDDLFATVVKDKFPGRTLDSLSPTEFDQVFKEAQAQRGAAQEKAKSAAKAVLEAKKATEAPKPKGPEQVLEKERLKVAKQTERREAAERNKKLVKQLAEYKMRTGSLPTQDSEHFKRLASGESVEQILGPEPVKAAQQAETATRQQIIAEGAPQAVEAEDAIHQAIRLGGAVEVPRPVSEGVGARTIEEERKAAKETTERMAKHARAERTKVEAKRSMFTTDVSKVIDATSPEEFSRAKKEAKDSVITQAKQLAEKAPTTNEKLAIANEAKKEMKRIDQMPTPEAFSVKTKDAARKASEAAGSAGSVAPESVPGTSANPEQDLLHNEQLLDQLKDVASPSALARVHKAIEGKDTKTQNSMLTAAIDALQKVKKQLPPEMLQTDVEIRKSPYDDTWEVLETLSTDDPVYPVSIKKPHNFDTRAEAIKFAAELQKKRK